MASPAERKSWLAWNQRPAAAAPARCQWGLDPTAEELADADEAVPVPEAVPVDAQATADGALTQRLAAANTELFDMTMREWECILSSRQVEKIHHSTADKAVQIISVGRFAKIGGVNAGELLLGWDRSTPYGATRGMATLRALGVEPVSERLATGIVPFRLDIRPRGKVLNIWATWDTRIIEMRAEARGQLARRPRVRPDPASFALYGHDGRLLHSERRGGGRGRGGRGRRRGEGRGPRARPVGVAPAYRCGPLPKPVVICTGEKVLPRVRTVDTDDAAEAPADDAPADAPADDAADDAAEAPADDAPADDAPADDADAARPDTPTMSWADMAAGRSDEIRRTRKNIRKGRRLTSDL